MQNITNTASKLIWGEQPNQTGQVNEAKEPPIPAPGAGHTGPFDDGNSDRPKATDASGPTDGAYYNGSTGSSNLPDRSLNSNTNSTLGTNESSSFGNTESSTLGNNGSSTLGNTGSTFGNTESSRFGDNDSSTLGNTGSSTFGNTGSSRFGDNDSSTFGNTEDSAFGKSRDTPSHSDSRDPTSFSESRNQPSSFSNNEDRSSFSNRDDSTALSGTREPHSSLSTSRSGEHKSTLGTDDYKPNAAQGGMPDPHRETDKTGVIGNMGTSSHGSDVIPSERSNMGANPTSGGVTHQKQQGADRPNEKPGKDDDRERTEEEILSTRAPDDHSGEPMHMHTQDERKGSTFEQRRESKAGQPGGQEHGKEEGTGEIWIKSSGIAADGGDFDATKPGAGREATRLMESKGLKTEGNKLEPSTSSTSHGSATGSADKEKVPITQKLKEKLHIGGSK